MPLSIVQQQQQGEMLMRNLALLVMSSLNISSNVSSICCTGEQQHDSFAFLYCFQHVYSLLTMHDTGCVVGGPLAA
jgi:hypothetical protein